jgi:hypothetical protein
MLLDAEIRDSRREEKEASLTRPVLRCVMESRIVKNRARA